MFLNQGDDIESTSVESEPIVNNGPVKIDTNFKLPISYLATDELFELDPIVSSDLELTPLSSDDKSSFNQLQCIYDVLLQPKHEFASQMIPKWNTHYTTNSKFLTESSNIITNMDSYELNMKEQSYTLDCSAITKIWEDVKIDKYFLTKYNFLDWEQFMYLNDNSTFLQGISIVQVLSPVISFIIPIVFLIFPFLLLKLRGIPISIEIYVNTLKDIAKNHFIGKTLTSMESFSWDKLIYILFMIGMYSFQIYQNFALCKRFYNNVIKVNSDLIELKSYVNYSIHSMESFIKISNVQDTYSMFNIELKSNIEKLYKLRNDLMDMNEFNISMTKFNNIGYMLKCYYLLHSCSIYDSCLRYSIGFEGYVNNLLGIHNNVNNKFVSFSKFNNDGVCKFKQQYYPAKSTYENVKNDCKLGANMIISSPNKSGKTTFLKTTAINIIFTQQFGCGFYDSAIITPYTHIHSYLNIPDTSGRDSLFQAESRRCKEIIDSIAKCSGKLYRHFCLFDELYSGTNPDEATKSGCAFLEYLQKFDNVDFMLTTHYISICKKFKHSRKIKNYKMDVVVLPDGTFDYTYKIKLGISKIKGGIRVLKDMGYPSEIINMIEQNK